MLHKSAILRRLTRAKPAIFAWRLFFLPRASYIIHPLTLRRQIELTENLNFAPVIIGEMLQPVSLYARLVRWLCTKDLGEAIAAMMTDSMAEEAKPDDAGTPSGFVSRAVQMRKEAAFITSAQIALKQPRDAILDMTMRDVQHALAVAVVMNDPEDNKIENLELDSRWDEYITPATAEETRTNLERIKELRGNV